MSLWLPSTFERALSSYGAKIAMTTIGQVKDLLKKELEPLHSKLETMSTEFSELRTSVSLLHVILLRLLFLTTIIISLFYLFIYLFIYFFVSAFFLFSSPVLNVTSIGNMGAN